MVYSITAVPDAAAGRVALTLAGGVPGDPLYVFRRDSSGVGIVRDTSLGTVTWPANLITLTAIPTAATGVRWSWQGGTSEVSTASLQTGADGPEGRSSARVRRTVTTAKTGGTSGNYYRSNAGEVVGAAGDVRTFVLWVRFSHQVRVQLSVQFRLGAALVSSPATTNVTVQANTWTRLEVTGTAGGAYDGVQLWAVRPTDSTGVLPVGGWEEATEASAQAGTGVVVLYDYEARQGELTDYLLTDDDGAMTALASLVIPAWGTWLKSPGRPFLNTRVYLENEAPVRRAARRTVVPIEGASAPVVLSEPRAGRQGAVTLATLTSDQAAAVDDLLSSGLTLLLDTAPSWNSPWRYVSVGDVEVERAYGGGTLALDREARVFTLGDLVAVEAPIGVTAVAAGRTYDTLRTLFANYAALAATTATYADLVVE